MPEITEHHDGFGLNESIKIRTADEVGPGGAHHLYICEIDGKEVAKIQFQCGPRNEPGSLPGVTQGALVAILLDTLRAFQAGPFSSKETGLILSKLEETRDAIVARSKERASRNVLGVAAK